MERRLRPVNNSIVRIVNASTLGVILAYELLAGEQCEINGDFSLDGSVIFRRGDRVTIVDIDPDPQAPGFKYVVFCERLGQNVRLSGPTLKRLFCPVCGAALGDAQGRLKDRPAGNCPECGWSDPEEELARSTDRKIRFMKGRFPHD